MPKSDVRPGGVAMESSANVDSAGSYESVISTNSGYSEDSMEHLSPEERACLMYLEETIEALELQEDSGLSNDELYSGLQTENTSQTEVNDIPSFASDFGGAEGPALNQNSEPKLRPSTPQTKVLCVTTDARGNPQIVTSPSSYPGQSPKASARGLGFISPPSDFMDKPRPQGSYRKAKNLPSSPVMSSKKTGASVDLEQLRQRASLKRNSGSLISLDSPSTPPPDLSPCLSPATFTSGLMSPLAVAGEPRSPPVVAPKPKLLPANILLKSHKTSPSSSDGNSGHSVPSSSDRVLMDHQKVRMEALRKLGLLKDDETDFCPSLSPTLSPKSRSSWGVPSSPTSPAVLHNAPLTPSNINITVTSPPPASVPPPSPPHNPPPLLSSVPDILPAPPAFSDPVGPVPSDSELAPVRDGPEVDVQVNTPPLTPPSMTRHLHTPKVVSVKSASLERSGPGLSICMANEDMVGAEQDLRQLRNRRPRPVSVGSVKEFAIIQGEDLHGTNAASHDADSRRSLRAHTPFKQSRDSQKLPRSEGISVLISPGSENGEDRRRALKRLGLIRD